MMKQFYFLLLFSLLVMTSVTAQNRVEFQINASGNDAEEKADDPAQTATVGAMDVASSDLELGSEDGDGSTPQIVGLRFTDVTIPDGAVITYAAVQFAVDEVKNEEDGNFEIKAQADTNPDAFTSDAFNISSRPLFDRAVSWTVRGGTWTVPGAAGPDQRTPNIKDLIQGVIDQNDWESGNALVLTITGSGTKAAESFDGDAALAPRLIVDYYVPLSVSFQINASDHDAEEKADDPAQTATAGAMDVTSSDLELGSEDGDGSTPQIVGLRFTDVSLPEGAVLTGAYIQFAVDEVKNEEDGNFEIKVQADPEPAAFSSDAFDISSREMFERSVAWNVRGGTWTTPGAAGPDQRTSDISPLLHEVFSQDGWANGNPVVFTITGTGTKAAESFDGDAALAPVLVLQYAMVEETRFRVSAASDDLEEYIEGPQQTQPVGSIDQGSSDLELGTERANGDDPQMVGIRFTDVQLEAGAPIANAYIQFTVDEVKSTDAASYVIRAQADPNPVTFDPTEDFNISSRPTFDRTVEWEVPADTWTVSGESGPDQRSADVTPLLELITAQDGWEAGNAVVFTIVGTGTKVAESYDGDPDAAPELVINLIVEDNTVTTVLGDCDDGLPPGDKRAFALDVLGTYRTGIFDEGAAEIAAYDPLTGSIFFTNADANSISILDITDPANPTLIDEIDMSFYGGGVNSVAVSNGIVAVAVEAEEVTDNGSVVFFNNLGGFEFEVEVGALPDMVTFTPDGMHVLVANEGEPNDDYTIDPEGSVSIIDVADGPVGATVRHVTFESYNDKKASLQNKGVRIFGPDATVAQDLEPEYIAVMDDGDLAYVGLQENNAFAVIDIANAQLLDILPLGVKDHNNGQPVLTEFVLNELIDLPALGTPAYDGGQPTVFLGGFSGLYFDPDASTETTYTFYAIPDRGPNADNVSRSDVTPEPFQNLRPFKLPDYQGRIARFTINIEEGTATLDDQIFLTQKDGSTPISGRGNVEGVDEVPVAFSYTGGNLLFEDFENQALGLNTFSTFSVSSDANWSYESFQGDFFAEMNGFGADEASDDYLITPALDLTAGDTAFLSFESTRGFDGGGFEVLISTDYDGVGNPQDFTFTDITALATLSPGDFTDTPSGEIDISAFISEATYIAFHYTSTGTGGGDGALWQVDDVRVSSPDGGPFAGVDYVDINGTEYTALPYDPYGGDFEGIFKDNNGDFWMCDEYRPAIYHFDPSGQLIERYVPEGTAASAANPQPAGTFGAETLPANYAKRRANRGFEAIAYDHDNDVVYAFIQTPLYNPDNSTRNNSDVIRILGINPEDGTPVSEYVYLLERNRDAGYSLGRVDKIGDAVYTGNGTFMILERDSSVPGQDDGQKFVFSFNLIGATNILGTALSLEDGSGGMTLEQMTADDLAAAGVRPVNKTKVLNLPSIGYLPSDKPEGLTMLPDGSIAVLNDNDFGIAGAGVSDNSTLGIIQRCTNNSFDASNRSDDIDIRNWPTLGYYLPDAIKAFSTEGRRYIVTANEGDARDYDGYSEEERVGDLTLDETAYPNAAEIQAEDQLGRLLSTTANGDYDGDGDIDQIYNYGGRSFSIFDEFGNLVYDSGNAFEKLIEKINPDNFNSNNDENDSKKSRSDDKGPEPEAIEIVYKDNQTYALIGLERIGGIFVYEITDPRNPRYVTYVNNRNFNVEDAASPEVGDLGVEDIVFIPAEDSPVGEPLVVTANEVSGTVTVFGVSFDKRGELVRIIHNNDGESKLLPVEVDGRMIGGAAEFKTVVDALRASDTIPSITLSSGDNFLAGINFNASLELPEGRSYYDAVVLDSIGYDAINIGNHDFDFGPDILERFINDFVQTQPPYLSANLVFTEEPGLQALVDAGRIAQRTIIETDIGPIGIIGLIYPELATISSPRNVEVLQDIETITMEQVAALKSEGVNKIILISHLQALQNELDLIANITDVDVVIAGGGDELLTNNEDNIITGLSKFDDYPIKVADARGDTVLVVTTPGEYRYAGNLVVEFDQFGKAFDVAPESDVVLVTGVEPNAGIVANVIDSVTAYSEALYENIIATTEVDLDGTRENIRTVETNQGNLVADAFKWYADQVAEENGLDPSIPIIAVQNGGGIRNNNIIPAGSDISEGTTFDILPFDNFVSILNPMSPDTLKKALENAVSAVENTDGRFLQISGFDMIWDTIGTPDESRIYAVRLDDGTQIVQEYEVVDGAPDVYVVTNSFTAGGGDDFGEFANTGFANLGISYQRVLYEYLINGVNGVVRAADYPEGGEGRIQKLQLVSVEDLNLSTYAFSVAPNPFDQTLWINYTLDAHANTRVILTDMFGRVVRTVVDGEQRPGDYTFEIRDQGLAPGMYTMIVQIDGQLSTVKLIKQ